MTKEGLAKLKDHEGLRLKPYSDTAGKLTIGWGRNLTDTGISYEEAEFLRDNDIARHTAEARSNFDWFDGLSPVRQDVVVELIFNMGIGGFSTFHNMIEAIVQGNWHQAAWELSNSMWAGQVQKERKNDLANAIENGTWN